MMKRENLSSQRERKLIELAQKDDLNAFNQLVLTYQDSAFSLASWILNNDILAEDAVQTTFLTAHRLIQRFRGGSFRAWLLKITLNSCMDKLHRIYHSRNQIELIHDDPSLDDANGRTDDDSVWEESLMQPEDWKKVEQSIQQLMNPYREVLILIDIEKLDYQEAAAVLNFPIGTVKSLLWQARARLQALLGKDLKCFPTQIVMS